MNNYRVKKNFRGPMKGVSPLKFKNFNEGDSFAGEEDLENRPPMVKDEEGYVIPLQYVEKDQPSVANNIPDQVAEKIEKIKNKDLVKSVLNKSNYSANGAMVGAGLGAITALYYSKSIVWFAVGGLIAGGLIGGLISNKIK